MRLSEEIRLTGVRTPRIILASVLVGLLVGAVVSAFEYVTVDLLLDQVLELPLWAQAGAPALGLVIAAVALRIPGRQSTPSTSDEYIRAFHERRADLPLRELPGKLVAGAATIGLGGSLGLEGPSIYSGAVIGNRVQRALRGMLRREESKLLLTAGAAAGVAAIFKAPATGVMFALESPYRDDVARRALLPALLASASGYLAFAAILGTHPVFPSLGTTERNLDIEALLGGATIGLVAGLAARGYSLLVREAKLVASQVSITTRLIMAGATLAGLVLVSNWIFDAPVTLGPGLEAANWLTETDPAMGMVAALFAVQLAATLTTIVGGGTGGLFIPLAVQGIIMGSFIGELVGEPLTSLYPTLGLAAFLGAGYRAPISAVMFVAESTGASPYVVPALIAAAVSQLVAGNSSVASYQRAERMGHLESRFRLPISSALTTDVLTVPSDATAAEFVYAHVLGRRERSVPVVDAGVYRGMCDLDHLREVDREQWDSTLVGEVMDSTLPTGSPSWTFRDAVAAMDDADIDVLPVVDRDGRFIGLVRSEEILKLDEILDQTGG